jgi:hypothetical protein
MMNRNLIYASLFTLFIFLYPCTEGQKTIKVTFLGNSLTYWHDLPEMIKDMAAAAGDKIEVDSYTQGGWTFYKHANSPESYQKITGTKPDIVVIQGNSKDASFHWWRENMMYPSVRKLNDMIQANGARPMLYLTYANWGGGEKCLMEFDAKFCSMPFEGYYDFQDTIIAGYMEIAEELDMAVAPVGVGWKEVLMDGQLSTLWVNDNVHPSIAGAYLTTCIFYASIFKKSPVGIKYYSIVPEWRARYLQKMAAKIVLENPAVWNLD